MSKRIPSSTPKEAAAKPAGKSAGESSSAQAPIGRFEAVQKDLALGWAVDPANLRRRLRVEVVEGDEVIAVGEADQLHKGLVQKKIGDARYGFVVKLPPTVFDGEPHTLRMREAESGAWLKGEQVVARTESAYGEVEGISSGTLFGWVPGVGGERGPALELRVNGKTLARTEALLRREDIVHNRISASAYGFRFDLKPHLEALAEGEVSVVNVEIDRAIAGTPFKFAQRPCWGVLDTSGGIEIGGWVVRPMPGDGPAVMEIEIDGELVAEVEASKLRTDLRRIGVQQTRCGFSYLIPPVYYDALPHQLAVRMKGTRQNLRGGSRPFKIDIRYSIDQVSENHIAGWIINAAEPDRPLHLDIWDDGELVDTIMAEHARSDVAQAVLGREIPVQAGFSVTLPKKEAGWTSRTLRISPYGDPASITGKDIRIMPCHEVVQQAERVASTDVGLKWLMPEWIGELRRNFGHSGVIYREIPISVQADTAVPLDVIIPVYKGVDETLACVRSVLNTRDSTPFELIVINDASPEPGLTAALRQLAEHTGFTLIENPKNLGFVATVNRGMKLHPGRDVILLNSDTVVPAGDWVSRMRQAALSEPNVASVTPFSNRATIFSLPRNLFDNDMPDNLGPDELDAVCNRVNPGVRVQVPTAVGFCMYIRREALREVGLFDEQRWAKGYGEENDFCIRSAAMGWKHVAACDVFVQHHGSISFQAEKEQRVRENLAILNHLYPDYPRRVERFVKDDPLSAPRARVVRELLKRKAPRYMLHVTHKWGGGIEVHINDLCRRLAAEGEQTLVLKPGPNGWIEVATPEGDLVISYPGTVTVDTLAADLRDVGVWHVHFHQTIGLGDMVWQIPRALGVPFDYTIHDYYLGCPRINLLDDSGRFCEQPDVSECEICVVGSPLHPDIQVGFDKTGSVSGWRKLHADQLVGARRIFAPSEDAKTRFSKFFDGLKIDVVPHPEEPLEFNPVEPDPDDELRVAIIGAIGLHKGHEMLQRVARLASTTKAPVHFVVVGHTCDDLAYQSLENVDILGPYKPDELQDLIASARCHAALFLSNWPETYSYTLTEAWRGHLIPVTLGLGAPAERIRASGAGIVLSESPTPKEVLDALLSLMSPKVAEWKSPDVGSWRGMNGYYRLGTSNKA